MPPKILTPLNGKLVRLDYIATLSGVTTACVGRWLRRGLTAEQIIERFTGPSDLQTVTMSSGEIITKVALAVRAGCSTSCMHQRLKKYSPDKALAMGPGPGVQGCKTPAKRLFRWGDRDCTFADLAVIRGYAEGTMRVRIYFMGLERAMGDEPTPTKRLDQSITRVPRKSEGNAEWQALRG